jgi:hypothetical protein
MPAMTTNQIAAIIAEMYDSDDARVTGWRERLTEYCASLPGVPSQPAQAVTPGGTVESLDDLPGMWDQSDFTGGATDTRPPTPADGSSGEATVIDCASGETLEGAWLRSKLAAHPDVDDSVTAGGECQHEWRPDIDVARAIYCPKCYVTRREDKPIAPQGVQAVLIPTCPSCLRSIRNCGEPLCPGALRDRLGLPSQDEIGRWITQTTFYDPAKPDACTGNCTEAAIASILGLPLAAVPRLAGLKSPEFWGAIDDFIGSCGFYLHRFDGNYQPEGLYLASGQSPRGCSHMVVMQDGKLVHDPHPSRAGIDPVQHVWLLVPKDPAATSSHRASQPEGLAEFTAWIAHEMPVGTVIGSPSWWAPRIARAYERAYAQQCRSARVVVTDEMVSNLAHYLFSKSGYSMMNKTAVHDSAREILTAALGEQSP